VYYIQLLSIGVQTPFGSNHLLNNCHLLLSPFKA